MNMFSSTLPDPFLVWEGEAPAEPLRRKLGRSLALPLVSNAFAIAKMFRAGASPSHLDPWAGRLKSAASLSQAERQNSNCNEPHRNQLVA